MPDELIRALVTVAFGALAGGLTNTVAVWMLFHPYRPPRLGRLRLSFLQGAIPKNQARLAATIGRTVGNRLLTDEDLARTFSRPEFRAAFDDRLSEFIEAMLERERGSLRDILPPGVVEEAETILEELVGKGVARLEAWIESEEFEAFVRRRSNDLVRAVEDVPVAGILTPAREAALAEAVDEWIAGAVESEGFREAVEDYLERTSHSLLAPDRTLEETLPHGLVSSFEKAIAGYLPLAIRRLGSLLDDPEARARFEGVIHDLLQRFLRDLKFHQRVVARLIVTEETVDRVLDTIEEEGAERISEMLRDPAVQDAMARGVNDAVVDFLRKPVSGVLGEPDDSNVREAMETLAAWAVRVARDPQTRGFLVEKLESAMDSAGARTWGDLFERIPPEKVSELLVAAARSEEGRILYREGSQRIARSLLDRPLGRPAEWLPEDAPERIEGALGDPIWDWLQTQVPYVVERIDVAGRVEEKVLEYPTAKMEALVRKVTDRELRMIVRLGYLLGGIIGAALVAVDALLPGG